VLSAYWQRNIDDETYAYTDLASTVKRLRDMGLDVYIIGDNPDFPFANPAFLGVRLAGRPNPNAPYYTEVRNSFAFNARLSALVGSDHFSDPMKSLCKGQKCLAYVDGKLTMMDNAHLSSVGAAIALKDMDHLFP
jgi:hypothetical protein